MTTSPRARSHNRTASISDATRYLPSREHANAPATQSRIRSGEFFAAGFEAYVVFDNEDGQEYSRGDDMMSVSAAQGQLLDADYYYRNTFDFVLDVQSAGASHAVGAGAYDSASRCYVFEFRREIASGDDRDVPMDLAGASATTYGWASY